MDEGFEELGLFWGELDAKNFECVMVEETLDIVLTALVVEVDEGQLVYFNLVDLRAEEFKLLFGQ